MTETKTLAAMIATEDAAQVVRARDAHWHVQGRRDALEGRPMHPGRAAAFPTYIEGYRGATCELRGGTR
jgi:hypothetical protein